VAVEADSEVACGARQNRIQPGAHGLEPARLTGLGDLAEADHYDARGAIGQRHHLRRFAGQVAALDGRGDHAAVLGVDRARGRPDIATGLFERAHKLMLAAVGPDDPKTQAILRNLG
jgi:hypothetical protein